MSRNSKSDSNFNDYKLGFEELVMAIGLNGEPDIAKKSLVAFTGKSNNDEDRGRLLAASHTLLAKELITLDKDTGKLQLQDDLKHIINIITKYQLSLRFSYGPKMAEKILAYYYLDKKIVKHEILPEAVHRLSWVTDQSQILQDGIHFLGFNTCKDFKYQEAEIKQSLLEKAKEKVTTQPSIVLDYLIKAGVSKKNAELLSDDLLHPDYRGSVLRVERKDGGIVSDRGFLVMMRKPRAWIFPVYFKKDEPYVHILSGTDSSFKNEVLALVK